MDLTVFFQSKAHIRILEILMGVMRPLCFRDLVDLSEVSVSSAQNALRYFEEIKVIKVRKVGQEKRYKLRSGSETEKLRRIFEITKSDNESVQIIKGGLEILKTIESANRLAGIARENA